MKNVFAVNGANIIMKRTNIPFERIPSPCMNCYYAIAPMLGIPRSGILTVTHYEREKKTSSALAERDVGKMREHLLRTTFHYTMLATPYHDIFELAH